jgi:hypothetical protein
MLYFDKGSGYEYSGYMLMVVDDETIVNKKMKFKITPNGYFKSDTFSFVMYDHVDVMPKKMTMIINPATGEMVLKCLKNKKVHASMFKDNQMSAKTILQDTQSDDDDLGGDLDDDLDTDLDTDLDANLDADLI